MLQEEKLQHFRDSAPQLPLIKSSEPAGRPNSRPIYSSPLDRAIDRHPLTVAPETPIAQVLALMNPMRVSCHLCGEKQNAVASAAKRSCVLVVEDNRPIGIFTERDIVKLTTVAACAVGLTIADVMTRSPITLKQSESQD
ncbi:CBS domain-containing protein, partial [Microcoleus sp. HI-ES]|nr:CBS domain-containing protein [Microcoleus sp. HI-ES]